MQRFFNVEHAERAVLVFHRELAARVGGHEIDLAGGQIGDVRRLAEAETVGFLRLLAVQPEPGGENAAVFEREVDFDRVGVGQGEAQAFGVAPTPRGNPPRGRS